MYLFGSEVVSVLHVLVLAQIRGYFPDLGVELYIVVLLLPEHDRVLCEQRQHSIELERRFSLPQRAIRKGNTGILKNGNSVCSLKVMYC